MKLLGRDLRPDALLQKLEARLSQRGIDEAPRPIALDGVEPRVDPAAFYLGALETHADPAEPLPLHTHRAGLGRSVLLAKRAFRKVSRVAVVDLLARQRLFNGYTRDAFLEVFNELRALRQAVEALQERNSPAQAAKSNSKPNSKPEPPSRPRPSGKRRPSPPRKPRTR